MTVPGMGGSIDESMFYDLHAFKAGAKLKAYIQTKSGLKREEFTLEKIFIILRDAFREEQLFDPANAQVIFCSHELERCLGVKALHVSQMRDLVLKQMTPTGRKLSKLEREEDLKPVKEVVDKGTRFRVSGALMKVLRTVPGVSQHESIFTFDFITLALSRYILMNKQRIFDTRNITLAMVQDDLLGQAFGVKGFHQSQVHGLLMKQLSPVGPEGDMDVHCCLMDEWTEDADGTEKDLDESWVLVDLSSEIKLEEAKMAGKRKLED